MADDANMEANRDALDGLPADQRKETEEILDEINKENADPVKPEEKKDEPEKKPEEDKTGDEGKKPESDGGEKDKDGKPAEDKKPEVEQRRSAKLIPAWVHERHKADTEKQITDLKAKIEELTKDPTKKGQEGTADEEAEIAAIAEKHGYEVDFVKEVVKLSRGNQGKIPDDIAKGLSKINEIAAEREQEAELAQYEADFTRLVVPLIKKEYGDDVPESAIAKIKEDLKAIAYSEEYAKVPYNEIYSGKTDFRGVVQPKHKGGESSRGGTEGADNTNGEALDLTKPLTDEQLLTLTDAQFETYGKNMEAYEKSMGKR